jgi:YD repeat-containing protein
MGRKVQNTDPDAGTTVSTFDEADRLISTTDSEQNKLITTYDALDRKTGLYKTAVDPANLLSDWTYDKVGLLGSRTRQPVTPRARPARRTSRR